MKLLDRSFNNHSLHKNIAIERLLDFSNPLPPQPFNINPYTVLMNQLISTISMNFVCKDGQHPFIMAKEEGTKSYF